MGLNNTAVKKHLNALFGEKRADELREQLTGLKPGERELTIVEAISEALQEMGGKYVLPFCFKNERGKRTSHHLIFVSKHVKGYEIMKDIMAKESSEQNQGVPSFEYNPTVSSQLPLLFELYRPLDELEQILLDDFAGQKMTMKSIYEQHHVGKRYIKTNYKNALKNLESQGKIIVEPPANKRRKNTFADKVTVQFASKQ